MIKLFKCVLTTSLFNAFAKWCKLRVKCPHQRRSGSHTIGQGPSVNYGDIYNNRGCIQPNIGPPQIVHDMMSCDRQLRK